MRLSSLPRRDHAAHRGGKSSEKLSPDQFNLLLENAEFAQAVLEAAQEKAEAAMQRARGEELRKPRLGRVGVPVAEPGHQEAAVEVVDPRVRAQGLRGIRAHGHDPAQVLAALERPDLAADPRYADATARMRHAGAQALLVGESLMRTENLAALLQAFRGR